MIGIKVKSYHHHHWWCRSTTKIYRNRL